MTRTELNNLTASTLVPQIDISEDLLVRSAHLDYVDQQDKTLYNLITGSTANMINYYTKSQTDVYLNAKADLVGGLIPSTQLPSYVDDVIECANFAAFPTVGEAGKIYIAIDTNFSYRWGGSVYVRISVSEPGGTNKQIQFNNSGVFAGATGFEYGNTNNSVLVAAQSSSDTPLRVKMNGAQYTGANPFEIVTSSGSLLASVNSGGKILTAQDIVAWNGLDTQVGIGYNYIGAPSIAFGSSNDASIYRSTTGTLGTDATLFNFNNINSAGTITSKYDNSNYVTLTSNMYGAGGYVQGLETTGSGRTLALSNDGGDIILRTGFSNRLFVNSTGSIGFNTGSPSGKYHFVLPSGSAATAAWNTNHFVIGATGATGQGLGVTVGSGGVTMQALSPNVSWQDFRVQAAAHYYYGGGGTLGMHIASTGNIGIRTTTTSEPLFVSGNIGLTGAIKIVEQSAPSTPASGFGVLYPKTDGKLYWKDDAGTEYDLTASGGVTTVGTFSDSSFTNGASISGSTITFGPADNTNPGMVTTGIQTFAGSKTFTSNLTDFNNSFASVKVGNVSNYPGVWFNQSSPSLSNYSFLFSTGDNGTVINAPSGGYVDFRVNNDYSGHTVTWNGGGLRVGGANSSAPTEMLDVRGNIISTGFIKIAEQSAPSTPDSGYGVLYPKSDGLLYWMDDAGTEHELINTDLPESGTYVATVANEVNIDDFTIDSIMYSRIGEYVTVEGMFTITPTASGNCEVTITLPIPSALSSVSDLYGMFSSRYGYNGIFVANPTYGTAQMQWAAPGTGAVDLLCPFKFSYKIFPL